MAKILLVLLVLIFSFSSFPMEAHASQPREVLYEHALSRAISRDPAIVPLDRESRQAGARARDITDEILAMTSIERDIADELEGQRLMAIAERNRLQRERQQLILDAEIRLRGHISNIAAHESNITMLEKTLTFRKNMLEQVQMRFEHGMASEVDVREAELSVQQANVNLESLALALENERQLLNRLIRQPVTANILVVYEIYDLPPVPDNLDRFIQQQIAREHNFLYWQEEVEIRRHEWQRQLEDPTVDNRYMRLQHQLAILERDMAERQAEMTIRGALAEWDRLQEQKLALEAALIQAQTEYTDMLTRLEAGLVTQIQVDGMALAYQAAVAELSMHYYSLWVARLKIEQAYAL